MHPTVKPFAPFAAALAIAGCNAGGSSVPATIGQSALEANTIPQWQERNLAHRACPEARPSELQCELLILNESPRRSRDGRIKVYGWGARDIEAAYGLPSASKGSGQIVAIVDAYDDPNVATDLAAYRRYYGLPKGKFYKFNQDGQQSHYPKRGNQGRIVEIDLDVEMVAATCPNCTIYLVEDNNSSLGSGAKAEIEAVKLGAHIVSNSFKCRPFPRECDWGKAFDARGVTYVAAAGDEGYRYGIGTPMAYGHVVSVGGTLLSKVGSVYNETVWPDTGGGCAAEVAKPSWQHDPRCSGRTASDVAAVAWNVAAYSSGWVIVGGTSVATPIVAGVFALAGNPDKQDGGKTFWTLTDKKRQQDLHVISSGADGCPHELEGSYLCTAGTDEFGTYSGPAGWGTPNGIGAF